MLTNRAEVVVPMALLTLCYFMLELWGAVMRDVAASYYFFDTFAGWVSQARAGLRRCMLTRACGWVGR